jgi:hypothetical protein
MHQRTLWGEMAGSARVGVALGHEADRHICMNISTAQAVQLRAGESLRGTPICPFRYYDDGEERKSSDGQCRGDSTHRDLLDEGG